uniref:TSA: Wollemia nobilis Ref_Wollemi_Transcript_13844_868 transcribed RNA sequence n=1 Tax=Wollemia nobilis TaxID=56998 RepID=A0A0C9QQL8_9CONI
MASTMMNSAAGLNLVFVQRNRMTSICRVPHRHLQVKCMAEKPNESPPANKVSNSTKFADVFSFSGPAPETINGRLAMLGFVSAIGVELASGKDVFEQLSSGGVSWFALSALVFSIASLVPMLNGITKESKSQEIMSSYAEMTNGRFAMLGLVALAITEYLKGGPLV